jgi:hypothetical protein
VAAKPASLNKPSEYNLIVREPSAAVDVLEGGIPVPV